MALNLTLKEMLDHSKNLPQISICCRLNKGHSSIWTGRGDDISEMFEQIAYVYGADYVQILADGRIDSFSGNYYDTLHLIIDCAAPDKFSYEYGLEDTWEEVRDQIDEDPEWVSDVWEKQIRPRIYGNKEVKEQRYVCCK